jgi:outer membrane protein
MVKKLLLALILSIPSMAFAQKFGVINTEALIAELPQVQEVQATIEASSQRYQAEFQKLKSEFDKKYTEFQQLDNGTPQVIRERRLQEIQELDQKINQFRKTVTEDLQRQENELMEPIRNNVTAAIQSVGIDGDFIIIFENTPTVYTRSDVVDVTPLVKAKLGVE